MVVELAKVHVNNVAEFHCTPDWYWTKEPGHKGHTRGFKGYHWNFCLWFVLKGHGALESSLGQYSLRPGACFIFRGDERYSAHHDPARPLVTRSIHFDYLDETGAVHIPDQPHSFRKLESLVFFEALSQRIKAAWHQGKSDEANAWMRVLLLEIDQQDHELKFVGHEKEQAREVERICNEIRMNPGGTYHVREFAQHLHCSPRHCSRLFHKFQGVSPQEFIVNTRIDTARALLRSSSLSVTRIAEILGFSNVAFFSRQFKKKVSLSPQAFRKGIHLEQ